jgi:hypothetical protein
MPKTDNGTSAATWRKADKKYREQQKARRKANTERRLLSAEAGARGISVQQLRKEQAEGLL